MIPRNFLALPWKNLHVLPKRVVSYCLDATLRLVFAQCVVDCDISVSVQFGAHFQYSGCGEFVAWIITIKMATLSLTSTGTTTSHAHVVIDIIVADDDDDDFFLVHHCNTCTSYFFLLGAFGCYFLIILWRTTILV